MIKKKWDFLHTLRRGTRKNTSKCTKWLWHTLPFPSSRLHLPMWSQLHQMAKYWQVCKQHFRETPYQKADGIKYKKCTKGCNHLTQTCHVSNRKSLRQDSKGYPVHVNVNCENRSKVILQFFGGSSNIAI
jgi:hypothetical protein